MGRSDVLILSGITSGGVVVAMLGDVLRACE